MKMINLDTPSSTLDVHTHIITKGFWEFYLEEPDPKGIAFGYVMGHESEFGYVDINELKGTIISRVSGDKELADIAPAVNFEWENTDEQC